MTVPKTSWKVRRKQMERVLNLGSGGTRHSATNPADLSKLGLVRDGENA
jgi:hypothetical protein